MNFLSFVEFSELFSVLSPSQPVRLTAPSSEGAKVENGLFLTLWGLLQTTVCSSPLFAVFGLPYCFFAKCISGDSKGENGGNSGSRKSGPFSSLAVWGVRASRLRCPVCASPTSGSLPTDRCTRLCSACSAAGSAEQRGHTEGPRRFFGYFLAGERVNAISFAVKVRFRRCGGRIGGRLNSC